MAKPMTREAFQRYLDYFNRQDFDGILSHFADDCVLHYMTDWTREPQEYATLTGKDAFKANYTNMYENFHERLRLGVYMSTEDTIFVELFTSFTARKDVTFRAGTLKEGETFYCNQYIDYDVDAEGKFTRIRIAQFDSQDYPDERYYDIV
ncbi:MAG: nuclear transport factor 2 family protein [Clostridiales bacterium]|nr:nuclear transport factor 2 family protein [Clostridiales bacterium]